MARKLQDKQNVLAPTSTYPYGDILDNPGDNTGTPVNRAVYADFHQFFAAIAAYGYETLNGLPDNADNTFQYFESLLDCVNKIGDSPIIRGLIGSYTPNNLIKLWGCNVTYNAGGTSTVTQGQIFYNDKIYPVAAASIPTPIISGFTLVFKINSTVNPNTIYLQNATSGTGLSDYDDSSKIKNFIDLVYINLGLTPTTWTSLSYITGYQQPVAQSPLQYLRKDGTIYLRGTVEVVNSAVVNMAILPLGYRPTQAASSFNSTHTDNIGTPTDGGINIYTTGSISHYGPITNGDIYYLDGISFRID